MENSNMTLNLTSDLFSRSFAHHDDAYQNSNGYYFVNTVPICMGFRALNSHKLALQICQQATRRIFKRFGWKSQFCETQLIFFFSVSVLFNMLKITKITFLQLFFAIFDILFIYILLFAFALASRQRLALCVGFGPKFRPLLLPKSLSDHAQNVPHDWPYVRIVCVCFFLGSLKRIKHKAGHVTSFLTPQYFLNIGPIHSLFFLLESSYSGQ